VKSLLFSIIVALFAIVICFGFSCYYSYFYPLEYTDIIEINAREYNVEPELIASVINVESSYNKYSLSNKGAVGLMQILPSTAKWVCKRIGKEEEKIDLFEPSINIQIGSYYLSYLLNYFGSEDLAICAYNAGMGNVKKWLSIVDCSVDGKKLENIPFKETDNYLKMVKKNKSIYKNKF